MNIAPVERELGVTEEVVLAITQAPSFEVGRERLNALKVEARKRYKRLALERHPDRVGDTPEATAKMAELNDAMKLIEETEFVPLYRPTFRPIYAPTATSTSTTGGGYGAHVVINCHVFVNGARVM